jgi:hypothetical protein
MPVTLCADKIKPAATAVLFLKGKSSLYLSKLKGRKFVAFIAAAVVRA